MEKSSKYQIIFYIQILLIAYMLLTRFALIFSYNLDADGAEFAFMHHIQQLLKGNELYPDPYVYPYSFVIYAPLYLYIVFFISKIIHLNYITDIHEIYVVGRIVSFLCVIGCLFIVDKLIKKHTTSLFIRVSSVFVFLNIISGHAFVLRSDGMKILFFLGFIYNYLNYFFYDKKPKNLVLLLLFSILSFLAKQDVIVYVILLLSIHFLYARNKSIFVVLVLSIMSFLLASIALKTVFGNFCFDNLLLFNLQTITSIKSSYNLLVVLFNTCRLLPVYMLLIYVIFQLRSKDEMLLKILITTSLIAAFLSSFFLFRPGSYLNYTYESSVLLMLALFFVLRKYAQQFSVLIIVYFALFFMSNLVIKNYRYFPAKEERYCTEYKDYFIMRKQLLPLLNHHESLFTPELMLSIFFADKNVIYGQEFHLDRLIYVLLGFQSESKLLFNSSEKYDENFVNGNVRYILTLDKKEAKEVLEKHYKHYTWKQNINHCLLYEFKE